MSKILKFPKNKKSYSDNFLKNVKPDVIGDFIKEQHPHLTLKAADAMALAIIYSTYLQLVLKKKVLINLLKIRKYIWAANDKKTLH